MLGKKKAPKRLTLFLAAVLAAALGLWSCDNSSQTAPSAGAESAGTGSGGAESGAAASGSGSSQSSAGSGDSAASAQAPEPFRIALVTQSDHQGDEGLIGVRTVLERYGDADDGGMVRHLLFPDNFIERLEQTIDLISQAADDPLVKAVVVVEAVPGTAEAFAIIRSKRPEVLLFAGESHEDASIIAETADLVVNSDFIARGYLIAWSAKEMGAETLVHVSYPRHMVDQSISRRRAIMEVAAKDLGLKFAYEAAPDPMDDGGMAEAKEFVSESFPQWIERYGDKTAFFSTNDFLAAALIEGVTRHGGYFVESDKPSPTSGYPEILGVDPTPMGSDWPKLIEALDAAVKDKGLEGRLGTWTTSLNYSHVIGLVELARRAISGEADLAEIVDVMKPYAGSSPGAEWVASHYVNPAFEFRDNEILIYQDTYVFGRGYLGSSKLEIPPKYKAVLMTGGVASSPPYHIAVISGDSVQGQDDVLGAQEMVRTYGAARDGGLIKHLQYTDEFLDRPELTTALIEDLLEDPLLKVVVINQAVPGTSEGFRRIKSARPDVWCLAGEPHEDIPEISQAADLVLVQDFISRGYLIPWAAKEIGADALVHVSFDRHLAMDALAIRIKIMEEAAKDLGIAFHQEIVPDPASGFEEAVDAVYGSFPGWLEKYGSKANFFATNDGQTVPILKRVAELGGYFVAGDIPSSLLGYPEAFELDLEPYLGDWTSILDIIEGAVDKAGGGGRMGVWPIPMGYAVTKGLVEYGKLLADGTVSVTQMDILLSILSHNSPGSKWNGSFINDFTTGKPIRNFFMLYQDVYIFGRGFIPTTEVAVPDKYYQIRLD